MLDLDEALIRFQRCGPEYGPGLSNHGPMAAEALAALGHGALINGLVDVYVPRLPPLETGRPLGEGERGAALGAIDHYPDWVATWEVEIGERGWRDALRYSLGPMLPGAFAGATHGLIRVAHAVRALENEDTEARLRELAFGLAYWAARYAELPGEPGSARVRGTDAATMLDEIEPVEAPLGLFTQQVAALEGNAAFARAVASLDVAAANLSLQLSALCGRAAELYLRHPGQRIAYVHMITAPNALRIIAPHLGEEEQLDALAAVAHCVAALHAVAGAGAVSLPEDEERDRLAESPDELRYRAACSLEEHAIKFAAACLAEDAIDPDPVLLQAAADAALRLQGAGGANC